MTAYLSSGLPRKPKKEGAQWIYNLEAQEFVLRILDEDATPSPCERFGGCQHRQRCAEETLACADFAAYLDEFKEKKKLVAAGDFGRYPSKEIYDSIFNRCDEAILRKDGRLKDCRRLLEPDEAGVLCCPRCGGDNG